VLSEASPTGLIEDLFRRESGRLVSALTRLLGPSNLDLAEDVVQDALIAAMQAWRFEVPRDPRAWILQVAKRRALDVIRRDRRLAPLPPLLESEWTVAGAVDSALAESETAVSQLAMMFSICDEALSEDTHVTLILRLLCGLSAAEIARAFLVEAQTIDRRLHRGRTRLQQLGALVDVLDLADRDARQGSVMQALYLLFNEGFHGSNPENPLLPAMCADALRLVELLLDSPSTRHGEVHALAALFCFHSARLETRLDADGVFVPLADQDRSLWDQSLIHRGVVHLSAASSGTQVTRWHLEAGIACEHAIAPSVEQTNWQRIVDLYDVLVGLVPGPVVALNRAIAIAELRGPGIGLDLLRAMAQEQRLSTYPFYWAALANLESRAGRRAEARSLYERAMGLSRSRAERVSYERRLKLLN
jgi:RNA polymerase sigma factor (sigma-70 family)